MSFIAFSIAVAVLAFYLIIAGVEDLSHHQGLIFSVYQISAWIDVVFGLLLLVMYYATYRAIKPTYYDTDQVVQDAFQAIEDRWQQQIEDIVNAPFEIKWDEEA